MEHEKRVDIVIAGGGLGSVAAALSAARMGRHAVIVEETGWLGGQLTTQGVPPDEHAWIEDTGCTASYRVLRNGIRDFYRRNYPLNEAVKAHPRFNPGMGNVSKLCHEPKVSLAVLNEMIAPYLGNKRIEVLLRHKVVAAETAGDKVSALTVRNLENGTEIILRGDYFIDGTELGDLLPLTGTEYVVGAESQDQTGELHALPGAPDPLDQQSFSWCFILDYDEGNDHTIEKPQAYDFWKNYQAEFWPDKMLSWNTSDPIDLHCVHRPIFTGPRDDRTGNDLWHFRRILYNQYYPKNFYPSDIVVVNWPQIDYWLGTLVDVPENTYHESLYQAKQLSLSLMYWMQTEAPRIDGGYGYRELRLRGDISGGSDGLAIAPYIREGRRIVSEFTVLEQHVGVEARKGLIGAENFADSIGVGSYRIDLHPSYKRNYVDITNWPYQIPLGALIPVRTENLLPACKNIGTTHITNGCYRLHPTEWNIGEAAGALAAYCLNHGMKPKEVRNDRKKLSDFQKFLAEKLGFQLSWPEDIRTTPRTKDDPLGI